MILSLSLVAFASYYVASKAKPLKPAPESSEPKDDQTEPATSQIRSQEDVKAADNHMINLHEEDGLDDQATLLSLLSAYSFSFDSQMSSLDDKESVDHQATSLLLPYSSSCDLPMINLNEKESLDRQATVLSLLSPYCFPYDSQMSSLDEKERLDNQSTSSLLSPYSYPCDKQMINLDEKESLDQQVNQQGNQQTSVLSLLSPSPSPYDNRISNLDEKQSLDQERSVFLMSHCPFE